LLITHATLITGEIENRILPDHALLTQNGLIVDLGLQCEMERKYPQEQKLDAGGQLVMPGNICAHTHFYGAFARGMAIPGAAPKYFPEILQKLWWPLDLALDDEAVRYSALVCLIDAIRHGTTTLIDHHASPNVIHGSLDIIADAVMETGVRANLCYEVTDRNGSQGARAGMQENLRFIQRIAAEGNGGGRLSASFGLHASLTLSESTLDSCREIAPQGIGFHIHVAEHEVDENDSLAKAGIRVVDRLNRHGLLGPRSIAVHAVHVDEREIELLAETGTWVTHQPRSNMNNGVGIGPVEAMLRAGVKVCLGNDGFSNAMWEEWKTAYLVHKLWNRDPRRMGGNELLRIAMNNNAALVNTLFAGSRLGRLEIGAAADMIFVDYQSYTPITPGNLPWHIVFGFRESMVTNTIVAGKVLMRDRRLITLDENAICARARELAPEIWSRYASLVPADGANYDR
jgi:putative selenium metabolism protein SsnA